MADVAYTRNSPFGVPFSPFPECWRWTTMDEMLNEIFADLRIAWVRDYLLHPNIARDAEILSDTSRQLLATLAVFYSIRRGEDGDDLGTKKRLHLNVPAFSVGSIAAGVSIQCISFTHAFEVEYPDPNAFAHFVVNGDTGAKILVSKNEALGMVSVTHMKHLPNGSWTYCLLFVDGVLFDESFRDDVIDWEMLKRGLLRSFVGDSSPRPKSPLTDKQFPYRLADHCGDFPTRSVFCSYEHGKPFSSFQEFSTCSWSYNCDTSTIRDMQQWGMNDRLRRLKITPSIDFLSVVLNQDHALEHDEDTTPTRTNVSISSIVNEENCNQLFGAVQSSEEHNTVHPIAITSNEVQKTKAVTPLYSTSHHVPDCAVLVQTAPKVEQASTYGKLTKIAPAPSPAARILTRDEQIRQDYINNLQRRLARKREAAARFNAKRSAARKLKNAERKKAEACGKGNESPLPN